MTRLAFKKLQVEILSETTFASGETTAGAVDIEILHDEYGLPMMSGKALRALLRDQWLSMRGQFDDDTRWAAVELFGRSGMLEDEALLDIGDAVLDEKIAAWLRYAVDRKDDPLLPAEILESLTDIRRVTAESRERGAPAEATLRSSRVVLRQTTLHAPLRILTQNGLLPPQHERVLACCALGLRHAGVRRTRGRGLVRVTIDGDLAATRELMAAAGRKG